MEIKSTAKFIRTAPDKIRILSALIKNKDIENALANLRNCTKYAADPLIVVIEQAKDIIKNINEDEKNFKIIVIMVNEGPKLKRRRILHQGRATTILKRMSHVTIILSDKKSDKRKQKQVKNQTNKKSDSIEGSA